MQEAGELFKDKTKLDAEFSVPLRNVFLVDTPTGCMSALKDKLRSFNRWEAFADEMPTTA